MARAKRFDVLHEGAWRRNRPNFGSRIAQGSDQAAVKVPETKIAVLNDRYAHRLLRAGAERGIFAVRQPAPFNPNHAVSAKRCAILNASAGRSVS